METFNNRIEVLAAACHSAWWAYAVVGMHESGETWDKAPESIRARIRNGVEFFDAWMQKTHDELRASGIQGDLKPVCFGLARLRLPEEAHRNWMRFMIDDGWSYGETKDASRKTHPNLVPFQELEESQRLKDLVAVETYLALRFAMHDLDDRGMIAGA